MNNTILKQPAIEPISLDEMKTYLRLDTNQENPLVEQLIKVARRMIEDYTSRALITQVHRVMTNFDECPDGNVVLPIAPVQGLHALPQIMIGKSMEKVSGHKLDQSRSQARVQINTYYSDESTICIDYRCGYGDTADDVPDPLKQAILLLVAELYENRPGDKPSTVLPGFVRALINPYRIMHVL